MGRLSINFLRTISASSLLVLASCAGISTVNQQDREAWLLTKSQVTFAARTVIRQKGSVYHFNLNWQQQGNSFEAQGFGLLGRQIFQISGDQEIAWLRHNDQQEQKSSREVISSQLGIDADPIELLHLLMAVTDSRYEPTYENNLPSEQKAPGFVISYHSYKDQDTFPLPSKITVQSGDIEVKMVLYSWQLR